MTAEGGNFDRLWQDVGNILNEGDYERGRRELLGRSVYLELQDLGQLAEARFRRAEIEEDVFHELEGIADVELFPKGITVQDSLDVDLEPSGKIFRSDEDGSLEVHVREWTLPGIGLGTVSLLHYPSEALVDQPDVQLDAPHKLVQAIKLPNCLEIKLHTDAPTTDQVEGLLDTVNPVVAEATTLWIGTRYYFDEQGRCLKLSQLPAGVNDPREDASNVVSRLVYQAGFVGLPQNASRWVFSETTFSEENMGEFNTIRQGLAFLREVLI